MNTDSIFVKNESLNSLGVTGYMDIAIFNQINIQNYRQQANIYNFTCIQLQYTKKNPETIKFQNVTKTSGQTFHYIALFHMKSAFTKFHSKYISILQFPFRISMSDCGTICMVLYVLLSTSGTPINIQITFADKKNAEKYVSISEQVKKLIGKMQAIQAV